MVVYCYQCGESFTRDEHLVRHLTIHSNVKPYECHICHMAFGRRDLCKRHMIVHGQGDENEDGTTNLMFPKTAGRTKIACTNCAQSKTKCDRGSPCTRCETKNLECIPRPRRRQQKQQKRTARQARVSTEVKETVEGGSPISGSDAATPPEDRDFENPQTPPMETLQPQYTPPLRRTSQSLSQSPNLDEKHIFPPGTTSLSMIQGQPTMGPVMSPLPADHYLSQSPPQLTGFGYGMNTSGVDMGGWSVHANGFLSMAGMPDGSTMMPTGVDPAYLRYPGNENFAESNVVDPATYIPSPTHMEERFSDPHMPSLTQVDERFSDLHVGSPPHHMPNLTQVDGGFSDPQVGSSPYNMPSLTRMEGRFSEFYVGSLEYQLQQMAGEPCIPLMNSDSRRLYTGR